MSELTINPETSMGDKTCFSLRAENISEDVFDAWVNDRLNAWKNDGWNPIVEDDPVQFQNGQWCLMVRFKNSSLSLKDLRSSGLRK